MKNLALAFSVLALLPSLAHAKDSYRQLPASIECVGDYLEGKSIKVTDLNKGHPTFQMDQGEVVPANGVEFGKSDKAGEIYVNYNDGCEFGYTLNLNVNDLKKLKRREITEFTADLSYTNLSLPEGVEDADTKMVCKLSN